MRKFSLEAIVLKSKNIKDADKIYTLLSKEKGRISVLAKGVRKVTSRRAGNMDSLNVINASVSENDSGFLMLNEVKTLKSFSKLKKDYRLSSLAFYMAELVFRNIEDGDEYEILYKIFVKCLEVLGNDKVQPEMVVNHFELELLKLLGYQLRIDDYTTNDKVINYVNKLSQGVFSLNEEKATYETADRMVKSFMHTMLDNKMKSLELI
jgi:DNA repair protein RecO (recombination protein O)